MAQIQINKDRFKEFLPQFADDVPYETELIDILLNQLPENARDAFLMEKFYKKYYTGPIFILQHCVYSDDINFFTNKKDAIEFLENHTLGKHYENERRLNIASLKRAERTGEPIYGYLVTIKEYEED